MTLQWSPTSRPVGAYNNTRGFTIRGGTADQEDVVVLSGTVGGAGALVEADIIDLLYDLRAVLVTHGFSHNIHVTASTNHVPTFQLVDVP